MKRKVIAALLCTSMAITLMAGCGSNKKTGADNASDTTKTETAGDEGNADADAETETGTTEKKASGEMLTKFADVPEDVDKEQTLRYAQGADPRGLDPAMIDDGESSKPICQMYEGLLKYGDSDTEVEPCLAESWEISEDGLTYTFKLREGVKFHDGNG